MVKVIFIKKGKWLRLSSLKKEKKTTYYGDLAETPRKPLRKLNRRMPRIRMG